ncbi:hypothetical protein HYG81_06775 [Natrinema zhouii]|uniref:Uncharacterized protein n=1 Tax=Natrinema zhouii TaxID=1710539 RepID=A0A7D6CQG1_9EURY|nr:hypothetical protein [Natrinema zhouii]QLK27298.1 hypothetical protein HYG81_06775 [Natrinema zhouii]
MTDDIDTTADSGASTDTELQELSRGAEFTASEDEVIDAIEDTADELGQSFETVRDNVAYIMDSTFDEEGVSTSFNESISGASLEHDEVGTGDPRLEALELYKLRQRI